MQRALWNTANVVMLLMFAMSVAVQYNDPDPLRWMAIYGAGLVACALELAGRSRWWLPAVTGGVALAWAGSIAPRVVGIVPPGDMFAAWEMKNAGVEESREMYGLLIVAAWMTALAFAARPRRTEPAP